jgi:hypothetical protein
MPALPMLMAALPERVTGLLSFPPDMLSEVKFTPAVPLVTLLPVLTVIVTLLRSSTPRLCVKPAPAVARPALMVPPLPDPLKTAQELTLVSVWRSSTPEPPTAEADGVGSAAESGGVLNDHVA